MADFTIRFGNNTIRCNNSNAVDLIMENTNMLFRPDVKEWFHYCLEVRRLLNDKEIKERFSIEYADIEDYMYVE